MESIEGERIVKRKEEETCEILLAGKTGLLP